MSDSPFIKVEATQFTEVGYHGKDVDSIINELVSLTMRRHRDRLSNHSEGLVAEVSNLLILSRWKI